MGLFSKFNKRNDNEKVFSQNLKENGSYANIYWMQLLFEDNCIFPSDELILNNLSKEFGKVDIVSTTEGLKSFAIHKYQVSYKDNVSLPAQVLIGGLEDFKEESIDSLTRSQCWTCEDVNTLLSKCNRAIRISDFMSGGLGYKLRCEMLVEYLDVILNLFPSCIALYWPHSQKVMTVESYKDNPYSYNNRFLNGALNIRFFNIQNTNDMIVDTTGLFALGLPDLQCHFNNLNHNDIIHSINNLAAYIFEKGDVIENGNTVQGLTKDEKWICQHESSLIQPVRDVIDVNVGENSAGVR